MHKYFRFKMAFPYKKDERECSGSISTQSRDYKEAIRIIRKKLLGMGYEVAESVCKYDERMKMKAIANILARNVKKNVEMAGILFFPKAKSSSVSRLLKRIEKISSAWHLCGIWLCVHQKGKKGYANFPLIADRILKIHPDVRMFHLDLDTEFIKPLFRWGDINVQSQTET